MCSAFDSILHRARTLCLVGLGLWCGLLSAAVEDSLTIRDKGQINKLAEILLVKEYLGILTSITSYSVESESDAEDLGMLVNGVSEGESRIFIGPDAMIQDNVDPEQKPGSPGLDRKVAVYANDFFMYFRGEEKDPVSIELLARGEPAITGDLVITKLLYKVSLRGHHKDKTAPYAPQKRVMRFIAQRQGERDWKVYIASDDYFDEGKGFVAYQLEAQMQAAEITGTMTPEMLAYRDAARLAEEAAERERAERKQRFDEAIAAGNVSLEAGDFEVAEEMYKAAAKIDPLSIQPLVLTKRTQKLREQKLANDRRRFDELLHQAEELKVMREYDRALVASQEGLKILPDDQRAVPLRDSLQVLARRKADREAAYTTGNFEACIRATEPLVKRDPKNAEALTLLAKCYHKLNKRTDALDHAERALKIEPFLGEALYLRAQLLEVSGNEEGRRKASVDYDVLIRHDPWKTEYVHKQAYMTCFLQGSCAKASQILQTSLQREPNNVETLYWLGRVHGFGQSGPLLEYDVSLKYLNQAIAIDSTCGVCHLERGVTLLMMDSVASAERSVAVAKRFNLEEKEWERVRELAKASNTDAQDKETKGFHAQAMKPYTAACVLHPDKAVYWSDNARNLMKIPHYEDAILALDHYIDLVDADYNGRLDRAFCLLQLKRYDEALAEVDRVKRNDVRGDFADKSNRLSGEAYFMKGDYASAERDLKESYRRRRENPDVLAMLAQTMYARGSYEEAEKFAEDAIDVVKKAKGAAGPEDPKSYFYLGLVRQKLGKTNASIESFQEARLLGYRLTDVEKRIGESYKLKGDCKNAIPRFDEVLRDTMDREVVMWMVECLKADKQYEAALRKLNDLEKAQPDVTSRPEFMAEKGFLFILNDMMTDANDALKAAHDQDPDYRNTILARIAMYWKGSRQEEAVTELDKLYDRSQVTEKELKDWPVLKDMIESRMWKNRK